LAQKPATAKAMGFDGKTLIHPGRSGRSTNLRCRCRTSALRQRPLSTPLQQPGNHDRGVISLDGRMVERLHLEMAERLMEKARRIDLRAREKETHETLSIADRTR
jgi:citrate lyase subunit beta/citryl-CoA lyase